jgi:sugar phosphate isomerase/epimerase
MKCSIRDGLLARPVLEGFGLAAQLGFDGVEVCIGQDYAESALWTEGGAEEMRAAAQAAGIAISSLSPGVFASLHPLVDDADKREEGQQMLGETIELCVKLDTRDILVPMFPRDYETWDEAKWNALAEGFKALAQKAAAANVTLGLETTIDADRLAMLLDKIDSPAVGAYYDVANTTTFGFDAPGEMRALGGRIVMIHVKDTDGKHLGEGRVPFPEVRAALHEIGYDGWLVLETPAGDDAVASAQKNLAFTRSLF